MSLARIRFCVQTKRCLRLSMPEPFTTKEFDELIPNSFVQEPSRLSMFGKRAIVHVRSAGGLLLSSTCVMLNRVSHYALQGLAFIALADIADEEELFLNYRCVFQV